MQRSFLANLFLLLVLNLLVKPFYILGIDAGVQDAVGSEVYGGYAALMGLSFLLNILLDLGITNFNTRHVAQHAQLMGKYLAGLAGVRVLLFVCYALVTVGVALVLGYRGEQLGMLGWLVANQGLAASILYLRSNIAGAQRFRQDSVLSVLDRVLLIGLVGWALWGRHGTEPFRIEWFVYAQTAAYGVTLLVAVIMVLRLSGRVQVRWRPAFSYMVVRQSLPYALLILLMTFYYRTDTLMLERMLPHGAEQAGIYAQGFRFFEAANMLGFLMAGLLLPMFSRMLREREDVGPLVFLALRLVLVGSLALAALCGMFPQTLLELRYSADTAPAARAFAPLMWAFVAVSITYVFGTLLTAGGDLRRLNRLAAAGAALNIGLNLLLIPRWQAEGAAWASLVTQWITALAQAWLAVRTFRLQLPQGLLWRTALWVGALVLFLWLAAQLAWSFGLMLVLYAPLALLLAVAVGLLGRADVQGMGRLARSRRA